MDNPYKRLLWGIFAKFLNYFISVEKKHWIFGSDYGKSYKEGSKYLIQYVVNNHPHVKCAFITQDREVYNTLNRIGIKCEMNFSLKGIITIAKADAVFTTQYVDDILFSFKKRRRSFYYLVHGQPYKKAINALSDTAKSILLDNSPIMKFKQSVTKTFITGYDLSDVSFVSASSFFLVPYMKACIGNNVPVKVLGMPRTDILFNGEKLKSELWLKDLEGSFIITYMPTHRLYGRGELSPVPFINNTEIQSWMSQNNIKLLIKQHPNMTNKIETSIGNELIIDISKLNLDPQSVLYHSDILITDFSSVFIDYLLLKRPIVFYFYDNYNEVEGSLYDIHDYFPDTTCYSEIELFEICKKIFHQYKEYIPKEHIISTFHTYVDDNSCKRYYDTVIKEKY